MKKITHKHSDLQKAIEDNHKTISALQAEQEQLRVKLTKVTLSDNFDEAGVTIKSQNWYVNENGKLAQGH